MGVFLLILFLKINAIQYKILVDFRGCSQTLLVILSKIYIQNERSQTSRSHFWLPCLW